MIITKDQLDAVRQGESVHLSEGGTDVVVVRADLFASVSQLFNPGKIADPNWPQWYEKLDAVRSLKEGWNGYTAAPPNAGAIENARLFLQVMQIEAIEPTRVAPSAMGGIAITRRSGDRKVFVEFYNDGRVYCLFSAKASDMNVVPVAVNSVAYRALVTNMRDYLNVERAA